MNQTKHLLDHGIISLIDYMGDDQRIVQAARVSYGQGTKQTSDDQGLIDYLMRHNHTSPFEQVELVFYVKAPMFVFREWHRHRTASLNEVSARYSVMSDEFYIPESKRLTKQHKINKQASSDELLDDETRQDYLDHLSSQYLQNYANYEYALELGIPRELARCELPVSLYSEMYWKIDLHNLFHFLKLRMSPRAQYEIRVYAEAIAEMIQPIVPLAYEAFENHVLGAKSFSKDELGLLLQAVDKKALKAIVASSGLRQSRQDELMEKVSYDKDA